ncbi:hypothetical protein TIFTF001_015406 [Ficus carica]|uniref:Uncharacterized protein n=1 Tax=Ficus carica TaxID=3494 RepID=A0AA88D540_FICCA|nr:hypothetical protein TIFTF001_015406 [Ficus carica]
MNQFSRLVKKIGDRNRSEQTSCELSIIDSVQITFRARGTGQGNTSPNTTGSLLVLSAPYCTCHVVLYRLTILSPSDRTDRVVTTCISTNPYLCPPSPDRRGTWHSPSGGPVPIRPSAITDLSIEVHLTDTPLVFPLLRGASLLKATRWRATA